MRGHGGFVHVTSEPNSGSTFTLHFPIPSDNAFEPTFIGNVLDEPAGRSVGTARNAS
jgi:hypothetical protein